MIFSDMCQRAAFLAKQAGWGEALPAPDWRALVNRGLQDFSWDTEFNEEEATITSVINQAVYTIDTSTPPRAYKSFRCVAYATQTTTPMDLPLSSESDEYNYDPLWWQRPAGTPARYLIPQTNQIRLHPPPSNGGDTITLRGTREAAPLVNDTDSPTFPGTWHEALSLRAAVLHCEAWVTGDDVAKVQLYREQYAGMVRACVQFLSSNRYARIQRKVQRPLRRRTYIRQSGRY
jgi:hypothetical protein